MANGTGLIGYTSLVLVESPDFPRQSDQTGLLHSLRNTGFSGKGSGPMPVSAVLLVENPEWTRQPDRTQQLFAYYLKSQMVTAVPKLPGPGVQPFAPNQFHSQPRSTSQPAIITPISGLLVSSSTVYGAMIPAPVLVGIIPQPGPGLSSPFNVNQFQLPARDTSHSSATVGALTGLLSSSSVAYGVLTGVGALSGVQPSASTLYGTLIGLPAGTASGLFASSSTVYGNLTAVANLSGISVSASLVLALGIGSGFQPLVPNTPILDVRLGVGYQPWSVHKGGVIG